MLKLLRVFILLAGLIGAQTAQSQTYCTPFINPNGCWLGDDVNSVTIGTFSDLNTGCSGAGYADRTFLAAIPLTAGSSTTFSITSTNGSFGKYYAMWIDLNSDGDFDDANEFVWHGQNSGVSSGSFIVPSTGAGTRRLRILALSTTSAITQSASCQNGAFWGELQDYTCLINLSGGCFTPVNLGAVTFANSAILSWDSVGTLYNVEYGLGGFTPGAGTTVNSTTHSITISSLLPNTNYEFYVRNNCTGGIGGTSAWNGPFQFKTKCTAVTTFPYTETFNNSPWAANTGWATTDDTISSCWNRFPLFSWNYAWLVRTGSTANSPNSGPDAAFGGTGNYLYIESNGWQGDVAYITSAQYNTTVLTSPWLTFQYHMFGSGIGNLYAEVSSDGGQTWVTVDSLLGQQQIATTSAWLERGIDVTAFKNAAFMFRFKALNTGAGWQGNIAIDHVTLGEAPACKKAAGFLINNITGSQAQLNWLNTAPTYYLEVGPTGFTQGFGNLDTVNNAGSYVLTGLDGNTVYDVYIMTDCSNNSNGTSAWAGPYNFRTLLRPDWEEDFDINGFTPNTRWTTTQGFLANPTTFTSTFSGWYENGWLNNGWTGSARCTFSTWGTMQDWFLTEQVDLGTGTNWELYFDMAATNSGTNNPAFLEADDSLMIVISTDGGLTWNKSNTIFTATTATNITNTGGTYTVSLAGYSGIVKIGFYVQSTVQNINAIDLFVDKIGMRLPAACPAPTALNSWNITANSLTLGWTGNALSNTYRVEYGPKGFGQGTGTVITGITTTSTPITNLSPVTQYDFYVTAECTADTSFITGPLTVLTGCPAVFATPYFENFEALAAGSPPLTGKWDNCWTSSSPTGTKFRWNAGSGAPSWVTSGPSADHTTGIADVGIYMYTQSSYFTGYDATLINGPFDLTTLTTPTLSFWYHMYGADMGELHVDVSTDQIHWTNDIFVRKGEQQTASTDSWLKATAALSQFVNDSVYIRFRGIKGSSNSDMAIDDIAITNASGCISPSGLTASTTTTTASLSWASYQTPQTIEWGPKGFYQGTGVGIVVSGISGTSHVLTGLSPNTAYDFYVKDTCIINKWVGPYTFSTECTAPLAGTYTVGGTPGASNFTSLQQAFQSLENCGVSAAVTLNLTGGNNGKNLRLGSIPGASASKTITINGTGTDTIYGIGKDFAIEIDASSYVDFNHIYFDNHAGVQVIWMHNYAHHITIDSCHIQGTVPGSTIYGTANISGSLLSNGSTDQGQNTHHITITNNTIDGGFCAISFIGEETNHTDGYIIKGNTFSNIEEHGIRLDYTDSTLVHENYMNGTLGQYSGYGLSIGYANHFDVRKNFFAAKSAGFSVYNTNQNGVATNSTIENNMFIGLGSGNGLIMNNSSNINLYFNSLLGGTTALLLYANNSSDHYNFRNNILHAKTGYAFENSSFSGSDFILDYNVYYAEGPYFVNDGTNYADLAAWKIGNAAANAHSLQGNVQFAAPDDLHIIGTLPNDVGVAIPGTYTDFDGDVRPAIGSTAVDIGADEFTPKLNDIGITQLIDPKSGCGDSTTTVTVRIRNYGTATVTSVPIHVEITGGLTASLNYTYTGTLANLAFADVTLGTFNSYNGGNNLTIKAYSSLVADEDASNDTLVNDNTFFIPQVPTFYPPTQVCYSATDSTVLAASNYTGVNYAWYANATDTVPASTSDSLWVPISGQPTWYLAYGENIQDSISPSGFVSQWSGQGGVMFNLTAKANVVVDSFDINAGINQGDTNLLIVHYIPFGTFVDNETNPNAWTVLDTVQIIGQGITNKTKAILNTPLSIPTGAQYAIYLEYNAGFNYSPSASFPIQSQLLTFVGGAGLFGSFSQAYTNNLFEGKIHAHSVSCSDARVPVSLNLNTDTALANFTTVVSQPDKVDVDASTSVGHLFSWDFGDGNSATGIIASHTYMNGGNYTITCVVVDTVCNTVDTQTFAVNMTIGVTENELSRSLNIYPNPSTGVFNIVFDIAIRQEVEISVIDALGRTIEIEYLSGQAGTITHQIDLSNHARGLYFVRITAGENAVIKKITKM
jgi:hypothetical protein